MQTNNLTRFESGVFQSVLEQIAPYTGGVLGAYIWMDQSNNNTIFTNLFSRSLIYNCFYCYNNNNQTISLFFLTTNLQQTLSFVCRHNNKQQQQQTTTTQQYTTTTTNC